MLGRDHTSTAATAHPAHPFAIYKRELDPRTTVVAVEGELDLSTAPRLKWMLTDAQGAERIVADLTEVGFMDSTALGVLVAVQRKLPDGSRLAIVCDSEKVLQIFEFSGIDSAFAIFPTLERALAHLDDDAPPAG